MSELLSDILEPTLRKYLIPCKKEARGADNFYKRGLTPPHRVKSISMASFTTEEVDLLRSRGNKYCRSTWLGLYEGETILDRDDQMIRDFMVDKYELKRYYLDAPAPITNGFDIIAQQVHKVQETKIKHNPIVQPKLPQINGFLSDKNVKNVNGQMFDFVADFGSADIYNAVNIDKDNKNNNVSDTQMAFANFDNNVAFSNNGASTLINSNNTQLSKNEYSAPTEDRYAALKDLDNAFKTQSQFDWSSGSNHSSYGSVTPNSVYSSPSPQSTVFNSPSQDQYVNQFTQSDSSKILNPFNGNVIWNESSDQQTNSSSNPFRTSNTKVNNVPSGFFTPFPSTNGSAWTSNPFTMGSSNTSDSSSNPFL